MTYKPGEDSYYLVQYRGHVSEKWISILSKKTYLEALEHIEEDKLRREKYFNARSHWKTHGINLVRTYRILYVKTEIEEMSYYESAQDSQDRTPTG
jgi:hypothetical protein